MPTLSAIRVPRGRFAPPFGRCASTLPRFAALAWVLVIFPTAQWRARIFAFALASFCPTTFGT
jgi:hypothetical protein